MIKIYGDFVRLPQASRIKDILSGWEVVNRNESKPDTCAPSHIALCAATVRVSQDFREETKFPEPPQELGSLINGFHHCLSM